MSGVETLYLVFLFVCLLLSAFFSSSETAFISLQRIRLEHMVDTKVKGAGRVLRMIQQPEKLLSTILLGNNFVNTAAAVSSQEVSIPKIFIPLDYSIDTKQRNNHQGCVITRGATTNY